MRHIFFDAAGHRRQLPKVRMALASSAALAIFAHTSRATDLDTISQRVSAQFIAAAPSDSTVTGYLSTLQSNGSWPDINYQNTAQTNWTPDTALQRMYGMAESYSKVGSSRYQNPTLAADISNAFNYWISQDPRSTNWFDNAIRTPQDLGTTMVLMRSVLTPSQIASGNVILNRANSELSDPSIAIGTNLVNLALAGIYQGIVNQSSSNITQGFAEIDSTTTPVSPSAQQDGIVPDHTYHFHGSQLYEGDYGTSILSEVLDYGTLAVGTQYALTTAQEHTLVDTLLDGTQWFIYGQSLDFTASGRDLSRQGFGTLGTNYASTINYALSLSSYRSTELQAFLARQNDASQHGVANSSMSLTGNRDYFDSDIMIQQRPGYYESARVTSNRNFNPESINGENQLGLYLADGVNTIMTTGKEFLNIEPVWNWRRLPGTTVEQNTASLQPSYQLAGNTSFAGGVSDGMYGAEALNYSRFNVAAKKSWFFFDKEEVALGAAINGPNATSEVDTTINQTLLTGTVSYETTGSSTIQTLTTGTVTPANLKWVYHNGVGYFFPTPVSTATIQAISQSGNWQQINTQYSNSTVSANVFTLYLNHGAHPSSGNYSYIAVPDMTAAGMDAYLATNPIQILRNDANVQAIRQSSLDITQAAFYAADSFSISTGQTVAANNPSAVMLQRTPNVLKLTASNPQNAALSLQVQLSGVTLSGGTSTWFDALGTSTVVYSLPGGNAAGSSVGLTLSSNGSATPLVSLSNTTGSAPLSYTATAAVTLPNNTTFQTDANSTLGFSGVVSGSASITKTGAGVLVLSGQNTFNGGVIANTGTVQVSGTGGFTGLGLGNTAVASGATLIGAGTNSQGDPFGYNGGSTSPLMINISGGTVTNLGSASYRITLPNLTFTGGTLSSAAGNNGDSNGQYSLQGPQGGPFNLTTNAASSTAVISAPKISVENVSTFNVTAGNVSTGSTPGVDLLISSALIPYSGSVRSITKTGNGVMELSGVSTYTGATNINGGTLILAASASLSASTPITTAAGASATINGALASTAVVNAVGNITFGSSTTGGMLTRMLAGLNIAGNVQIAKPTSQSARTVLVTPVTFGGILDLTSNDLIAKSTNAATVFSQLKDGFNSSSGYWNGSIGIVSSTAANDPTFMTTLGYRTGGSTFDGITTSATDTLIKYTYYGDADLNGTLNGADYQQIDNGFGNNLTGWSNGDFNYDGIVNGSDFALIDNTFNQITATGVSPLTATPASIAAVPEPAGLLLAGLGIASLLRRNRNRH